MVVIVRAGLMDCVFLVVVMRHNAVHEQHGKSEQEKERYVRLFRQGCEDRAFRPVDVDGIPYFKFPSKFIANFESMWWIYALLSALLAALTAIFAKVGVAGVNSNLATAIRTVVILFVAWAIVLDRGEAKGMTTLSKQNLIFLIVSGIATGLSWVFYFKALQLGKVSQVAPVDKLSVAITILLSVLFLGEALTWNAALNATLIITRTIVLIL